MLTAWLIIVGAVNYRKVNPEMAIGPSWRQQVAEWRRDNTRSVVLWPRSFQLAIPK